MSYVRRRLQYTPKFEGPIQGWAFNFAAKNIWRLEPHCDIDDMVQEAAVCFCICKDRYQVQFPEHFMSLFKTVYRNRITDLANKRMREYKAIAIAYSNVNESDKSEGPFDLVLYQQCPKHIKKLINSISNKALPAPRRRQCGKLVQRQTNDSRYNEYLGLDVYLPLTCQIKNCLTS